MTIPTYDPLTSDDKGADKILTTGTMEALDQNPVSIAGRGTSAPIVQVSVIDTKITGTAASWTWPSGVTAATVTIVGGGGGSDDDTAYNGGDSSITYNSITYTAGGGGGGTATNGVGGTATGGDVNVPGQPGSTYVGGSSGLAYGHGGGNDANGTGYGGGGGPTPGWPGGGGGTIIKRIVKVDGLNTITYTVGAGGTGGGGGNQSGAAGAVIFEY